jgi:hypothetical protein|nr:MAG TPA: amino acid transporter [Caudoviricetes sp.]
MSPFSIVLLVSDIIIVLTLVITMVIVIAYLVKHWND